FIKMSVKSLLGFLSLCFILSGSSASQPLCDLMNMIGNETWRTEAIETIIHGDISVIKCTAGCFIYVVNRSFGDNIKQLLNVGYMFFENCIKLGVRQHNPCKIMDCLITAAENAINMFHQMGLKVPILDFIENLPIFSNKNRYDVETEGTSEIKQFPSEKATNRTNETQIPVLSTTTRPNSTQPPLETTSVISETAITPSSYSSGTELQTKVLQLVNILGVVAICKIIF
ncbi:hypothetical protein L9F63_016474, partial [Diploptera punctata]